jgi:hypothetical protein
MLYPTAFSEHIQNSGFTKLCDIQYPHDSGFDHGEEEEFVLILVPTDVAETVLASATADQFEELTLAEYDEAYAASYVTRDFVVDTDLMSAITNRIAIVGKDLLTTEEAEAMDPDNARRGMTREKKTVATRMPSLVVGNTSGYSPRG